MFFSHIRRLLEFPTYTCQAVDEVGLIAIERVVTAADDIIELQEDGEVEFGELVLCAEIHVDECRQFDFTASGDGPTCSFKMVVGIEGPVLVDTSVDAEADLPVGTVIDASGSEVNVLGYIFKLGAVSEFLYLPSEIVS